MKVIKALLLVALFLFMVPTTGYANSLVVDTSQAEVVTLDNLAMGMVDAKEMTQKASEGKEYVIHASKGQTMPMKMTLDFPFLKAGDSFTEVAFTQDTYIFISKNRMLISPDGQNWSPVHDMKGIKTLYNAKHGTLNIGLTTDDEHGPTLDFSIKLQ